MPYRRILVGVDGSKASQSAFKHAIELAKANDAKLYILYVLEKLPNHIAFAIDVVKFQTTAIKKAESLLARLNQIAKKNKVKSETQLVEIVNFKESIGVKILKAAKKHNIDCLVLGTHGRTGLKKLLLGSVAEEVLKSTALPVLLVC